MTRTLNEKLRQIEYRKENYDNHLLLCRKHNKHYHYYKNWESGTFYAIRHLFD